MNLTEVIVAATVFLGACSGAAQMGASSAAAMSQSRARTAALEQIEAQVLALTSVITAARAQAPDPASSCVAVLPWLQAQLEAGLPPLGPGVTRELSVDAAGEQLQIAFQADGGLRRLRRVRPAAFGLCGLRVPEPLAANSLRSQEPTDAAL